MADKKKYDNSVRNWTTPKKRGNKFAADLKAKVHTAGPKEGEALINTESAFRRGYFMSQSDNAGVYLFKKAIGEGKTKEEAFAISKIKGKPKAA